MPDRLHFNRFVGPLPPGAALVTRATIFGNPWSVGVDDAFAWPSGGRAGWRDRLPVPAGELIEAEVIGQFRDWLERGHLRADFLPDIEAEMYGALRTDLVDRRALILERLGALRGRDLACSCLPGAPCHADVLMEMANA